MSESLEFGFIKKLARQVSVAPESLKLEDDGAVINFGGQEWVIVKDLIQEGIHVPLGAPSELMISKAIRTNLSDLASMGARPKFILLGLGVLASSIERDEAAMIRVIKEETEAFGIDLIGGDTTSTTGPATVSITALGDLQGRKPIIRSGASAQEDIWVTGSIGDSALGLFLLQQQQKSDQNLASDTSVKKSNTNENWLIDRYHYPQPRIVIAQYLSEIATAMIDISDGLAVDAAHIANASSVRLEIEMDKIPTSEAFQDISMSEPIDDCFKLLLGGDDYELLFTAKDKYRKNIKELSSIHNVRATLIGRTCLGDGVKLVKHGMVQNVSHGGFTHF